MRLYLVRHGKAEDPSGDDHERQLTPDGAARVETEARVIARLGIQPDRIYSSPRVRARQTAAIIARALNSDIVIDEAVNFDFDVQAVQALINGLPVGSEVMFVGHNPSMEQTIFALTGARVEMKVGSLARIDIQIFSPELLGTLIWLIAPRVFDALEA
jgi:phosphohistidine phosphatase